jgi:hypothetical protein
VYDKAGFTVSTIIMDYEFEKVHDHVPSININTTAACMSGKSKGRFVLSRNKQVELFVPYLTRHYLNNWSSTFFTLLSCG